MFDSFIYGLLDKIVNWCERYREYRIKKSLPKSSPDEVKKWASQREKSYK
jgi:hypothetical protein